MNKQLHKLSRSLIKRLSKQIKSGEHSYKMNFNSFCKLKCVRQFPIRTKHKIFEALKIAFFKNLMARKRFSIRGLGIIALAYSATQINNSTVAGTIIFDTNDPKVARNHMTGILRCKDMKKLLKS